MTVTYDKYYQTENLFGEPYPELISFFTESPEKGKLLDLGCGQGRDAIALARLGYEVIGIDNSKVGIDQMNQVAKSEKLNLTGQTGDIYAFEDFAQFDFILLDSMLHFAKRDKKKEVGLIQNIALKAQAGCMVVVCIQDTGSKVQILNNAIDHKEQLERLVDTEFKYTFTDDKSGHQSISDYRMIVAVK